MVHELVMFDKQEWNRNIAEIARLREEFYSLPEKGRLDLGSPSLKLLDQIYLLEAQTITNEGKD